MDNPVSKTPNQGKNRGRNVDVRDLVHYFGTFKVGRDGNSWIEESASQSNNASSSVSTMEEDAVNGKNSKKINNQTDVAQETSDNNQWLSKNSVSDPRSIWGYQFFVTEENLDAESSSRQLRMGSFGCCPSMSNCASQFEGIRRFDEDPRFRPYNYGNYQFRGITSNGLCYGNDYGTTNNDLTYGCQWNQREIDTFPGAGPQFDFDFLLEILDGGDKEQIEMVLLIFQGSYLSLMTEKNMFVVFQKLVDACSGEQLEFLVADVLSWSQLFINAAFCKQGASSIVRLIKKLKKSSHAFNVTKVLSTEFLAIMTHDIARVVIQQCLIHFKNQPNKILYEEAIHHFQDLAIHKVGSRALNEIIDTIAGEQRSRLLNHIADQAAYLSNDPYGNYVVQNVLSLKNRGVSTRIVLSLRGHFVQLAKKTGGSHVVEKCMESSNFGIVTVVQEILDTPKTPFQLAQDQFGNYVIQKALKMTKEHGFSGLYDSLVKSLQPHCQALNLAAGGKNVLNLLKDDDVPTRMTKLKRWKRQNNVVVDVEC